MEIQDVPKSDDTVLLFASLKGPIYFYGFWYGLNKIND